MLTLAIGTVASVILPSFGRARSDPYLLDTDNDGTVISQKSRGGIRAV